MRRWTECALRDALKTALRNGADAPLTGTRFFRSEKNRPEKIRAELLRAAAPRRRFCFCARIKGLAILSWPRLTIRALTAYVSQGRSPVAGRRLYLKPVMEYYQRGSRACGCGISAPCAVLGILFLRARTAAAKQFDLGDCPFRANSLIHPVSCSRVLVGARRVLAYDTRPFYGGAELEPLARVVRSSRAGRAHAGKF